MIASDLVKRGYNVSFLTGSCWRESVESIPARFVPLEGTADYDGRDLDKDFPARKHIPQGPQQIGFDLMEVFIGPIPDQFTAARRFLADTTSHSSEPVILVQDTLLFGTLPLLMGAPGPHFAAHIAIGIAPIFRSSIDTAPVNMGLPPDSSEEGRIRNKALYAKFSEMLAAPQALLEEKCKQLGVKSTVGPLFDLPSNLPDRYLQLCIEELEYPRSDAPLNLWYIGALPAGSESRGDRHHLPPWWDIVVKHEKPLIVVSQGTIANDPKDLIIPTIEALKDLDVLVVACLVRSDSLEDFQVPSNTLIAKWIPFDELFKYTDVIVSNGGYGTVQQGLSAGVPLVVGGESEDKPEVCAHVAWTGAAINLVTATPPPSAIHEAVQKVLKDPNYKTRASELQAKYAKTDPLGDVARTIEELYSNAERRSKLEQSHLGSLPMSARV